MQPALASPAVVPRAAEAARSLDPGRIAAWSLPFALVLYLSLRGGGFDVGVWGEVGVAVWWIVLLAALVGLLPGRSLGSAEAVALVALLAFAGWATLSLTWTESSERTAAELGRIATYLGVLVLALALRRAGRAAALVNGVTAAVATVSVLALLSRLHPAWFPSDEAVGLLGERNRLNYPLNYFNAVAAIAALGIPLLLGAAWSARTRAGQAAAAAALPAAALTIFFTLSRGGALAAAAGVAVLLALAPDRLPKLATALVAGAGSAILIAAADQRPELQAGVLSAQARGQGDEMLAIAVIVCLGVALVQLGIVLAARGKRPAWAVVSRRRAVALLAASAAVLAALAVALGMPGKLSDGWRDFKRPEIQLALQPERGAERFTALSGRGRYQIWQQALDANRSHMWRGIGPGTFEFWWERHSGRPEFIRDAHSLYLEALAELGIVGLALIGAFLLTVLAAGAVRSLRPSPARLSLAAATGACAGFCLAAGIDWIWKIPALPVVFLLLAGALLGGGRSVRIGGPGRNLAARGTLVALALAALVATVPLLAGVAAIKHSEADVAAGRLSAALSQAQLAERLRPYAASPKLQRAVVLELRGRLPAAARAARRATAAEPTNWRTWLVLSRIEGRRGRAGAAVRAYGRSRALNPRSPLFNR